MCAKKNDEPKMASCDKNSDDEAADLQDETMMPIKHLRRKFYIARTSLLTELYNNKHIATVYHLFLAILVTLVINNAVLDYISTGYLHIGFKIIGISFSKFHWAVFVWLSMFTYSFLCYYGFKCWALILTSLPKDYPMVKKAWNWTMLLAMLVYYAAFLYLVPRAIIFFDLSIALSLTLLSDTLRFMMIYHSFIRSNAPRVLNYREGTVKKSILCPTVYQFLYFSFAPTLIYQDSYPRSQKRSWYFIVMCLCEFLGVVLFMSYILENFLIDPLKDFGLKRYSYQTLVLMVLKNAGAGLLLLFNTFYVILHIWMNAFAELLLFSDRCFYSDWWTSTSFRRYYKTWNVVVHDWLFKYVYKDFYENVYSKSTTPARILVFLISGIWHEYVLAVSFRFFIPILFVEFIFVGVPFMFYAVRSKLLGNTFFLYSLGLGTGIIMTIYTLEYYCRINCPIETPTFTSYLIPHMFECLHKKDHLII